MRQRRESTPGAVKRAPGRASLDLRFTRTACALARFAEPNDYLLLAEETERRRRPAQVAQEPGTEPSLLPSIRFHDLRHSHASLLTAQGCSIEAISKRLGHSTVTVSLETYGHLMPSDDAELVATLQTAIG